MPSRTKPQPLSNSQIQQIATDIAGGHPPMVWFTAAAVGVPEGRSGKVVALGNPDDGDFLRVRPTGSKDVLSFSPIEVTLTKPARKPARTTQSNSPARKESSMSPSTSAHTAPSPVSEGLSSSNPAMRSSSASAMAEPDAPADVAAKSAAVKSTPPPTSKPAKSGAGARKVRAPAPEVTVTLTGTADGEWSVEVMNGKKRPVRGLPVASSAVAQAAKILHPEVADVVAAVLETVRGAQQAKVQQLQAELAEAERLLAELGD